MATYVYHCNSCGATGTTPEHLGVCPNCGAHNPKSTENTLTPADLDRLWEAGGNNVKGNNHPRVGE